MIYKIILNKKNKYLNILTLKQVRLNIFYLKWSMKVIISNKK